MKNLHQYIASIFNDIIEKNNYSGCELILDRACSGDQSIPLFCSISKSNQTEYCNVDILILRNERIKVLVEIDVSKIIPTQICGKFLTSALSFCYIHKNKSNCIIEMDNSVTFIQVVDTSNLDQKSKKYFQFENIEKSIKSIIPLKNSKIGQYYLLQYKTDTPDIMTFRKSLENILENNLL